MSKHPIKGAVFFNMSYTPCLSQWERWQCEALTERANSQFRIPNLLDFIPRLYYYILNSLRLLPYP